MPFNSEKLKAAKDPNATREAPPGYKFREMPPGYREAPRKFDPEKLAKARRIFREEDFLPRARRFVESDFIDGAIDTSTAMTLGVAQKPLPPGASLTNRAAHFFGENAAPSIGAGFAAPGGPFAMAAGAAAGRLAQKVVAQVLDVSEYAADPGGPRQFKTDETIPEMATDAAGIGAGQLALSGLGVIAGKALSTDAAKAFGRMLAETGGDFLKAANGVSEKFGKAAIENLHAFVNAPAREAIEMGYRKFYDKASKALGGKLVGRREFVEQAGKFERPGAIMDEIERAIQKQKDKTLSLQEAVNASQGARVLRDMRRDSPSEVSRLSANQAEAWKQGFDKFIDEGVSQLDQTLQGEWQRLREATFWREARDAFSTFLPRKKSGAASVFRSMVGMGGALGGATVNPAFLALPVATSPIAARTGLEAAYMAGRGLGLVTPRAGRMATYSLEDAYMKRRLYPSYE